LALPARLKARRLGVAAADDRRLPSDEIAADSRVSQANAATHEGLLEGNAIPGDQVVGVEPGAWRILLVFVSRVAEVSCYRLL
jgi:hypothetical protein